MLVVVLVKGVKSGMVHVTILVMSFPMLLTARGLLFLMKGWDALDQIILRPTSFPVIRISCGSQAAPHAASPGTRRGPEISDVALSGLSHGSMASHLLSHVHRLPR